MSISVFSSSHPIFLLLSARGTTSAALSQERSTGRATQLAKSQYPGAFQTPNPRTAPGRRTELQIRWTPHENRGNLPGSSVRASPLVWGRADGADRAPRCQDGGAQALSGRQESALRRNETRLFFLDCKVKTTRRDYLRTEAEDWFSSFKKISP